MSTRLDWRDVARMPWDLFAGSMDWLCRSALPPGTYERRYHDDRGSSTCDSSRGDDGSYTTSYSRDRAWGESYTAGSDELCGDDIKLVNYKLVFTKPGKEKVLTSGEELVTYKTDKGTYSGLKIARFLERSSDSIPEDDHHYIRAYVDVVKRYAKEHEDYDRRRNDLLEREVEILSSIEKDFAAGNQRRAA